MKVGFINMPIEFYSPVSGGAISTIIAETGAALIEAGHQVDVLTRVDGTPTHAVGRVVLLVYPQREEIGFLRRKLSGLRRRLSGWDWPGFDAYLRAVRREVKRQRYDVLVVFNDLVTPKYLRRIAPEAKILAWLQNEWRTNQRSLRATVAATDRFLTCSDAITDWTAETHGISKSKFVTVHSGVNSETFKPVANAEPSSTLRVLFVGRIDPNKGPDIAAKAVSQLRGEGLDVTFTVAGGVWFYARGDQAKDPYFQTLTKLVDDASGTMLGHVTRDRLPDIYRSHDVVCVLSRSREPFGLVVLEAMASGCAVIASNRGGLPEACGSAGVLVDPDDQVAVTNQLREWAVNRASLEAEKRRARARAGGASWDIVASQILDLVGPR